MVSQNEKSPLVGVLMGSSSDWETMQHTAKMLEELGIEHEVLVASAHRTPDLLMEYASTAESRGLEVLIAGAGGAAALPGMAAAKTFLPVLGVPIQSAALLAASMLGGRHPEIRERLKAYREKQAQAVLAAPDPRMAGS
jgi:5-(carboxyamino)imidazole ribonucleotide mutase